MNRWLTAAVVGVSLLCTQVFGGEAQAPPALKSVLPKSSIFILYVPDVPALHKSLSEIIPQMPPLENIFEEEEIPVEAINGSLAVVGFLPDSEDDDSPELKAALILPLKDPKQVCEDPGEADEDGIFEGEGTDITSYLMPYNGFLACSDEKETLKLIAAEAKKGFYKPAGEAARLANGAQLFFHLNMKQLMVLLGKQYEAHRDDMAEGLDDPDAPKFITKDQLMTMIDAYVNLGKECLACDYAVKFDEEGILIQSAAGFKADGKVARYLTVEPGTVAFDTKLPAISNYMGAIWCSFSDSFKKALTEDMIAITNWYLAGQAANPDAAETVSYVQKLKDIMSSFMDVAGGKFSCVMSMREDGIKLVELLDVPKPVEFKGLIAKAVLFYDEVGSKIMGDQMKVKYTYEKGARTVDGVNVDRMKTSFEVDDPEIKEAFEKMMAVYGPDGLSSQLAIVGNRAIIAMGDDSMDQAIAAQRGKEDVPLLDADETVKKVLGKVGANNAAAGVFVPARFIEAGMLMMSKVSGFPMGAAPLPAATPASFGVRAVKGNVLRADLYVPRACVFECISIVQGMFGGFGPPGGVELDNDFEEFEGDEEADDEGADKTMLDQPRQPVFAIR